MDSAKRGKDGGSVARPVRRPMNAFLIFCKRHRSLVREKNPQLDNRSVTRILGELWASLPADDKAQYISSAKQYKEEFMKMNPNYKWYNPEKHNTVNSAKPATRPSNAFVVYHGEKPHTLDVGITPGKLADPSCMGGLSLLLMAGEQTLHSHDTKIPGHDSQIPGHDSKIQGHDSQIPGHKSQIASHNTKSEGLTQSNSKEPVASDETMCLRDKEKKNTALLQLAEMCTSRLNDNTKTRDERDVGRDSSPHQHDGHVARSSTLTPPWTPKYEGPPSVTCPPSPSLTAKDSPMDLSNKKHEHACPLQMSPKTWRGAASAESPLVDDSRVSEALDLTVPSSKPLFTELNIPCRKPVTKHRSKPHDSKTMVPPSGPKEKHSRCGSSQKPAAEFSRQNFTISGQNVVDKVLESLYYHMNSQNATGDNVKTCSVRSSRSAMKHKESQQKNSLGVLQKVSLGSEPNRGDTTESINRQASIHKQYTRPADVSTSHGVKTDYGLDHGPAASTTFKVGDIKPSMTFGEIQETLIRRAVEAPASLFAGSVRRSSTGNASRAEAMSRFGAGLSHRAASNSDTPSAQNAPSKTRGNTETSFKEESTGNAAWEAKGMPQEICHGEKSQADISGTAEKKLPQQQPFHRNSQYPKVNSGRDSSFTQTGHIGDRSPCKDDAGTEQESRGHVTLPAADGDRDGRHDVQSACDKKDIFSILVEQEVTCKIDGADCHMMGDGKDGDCLVTDSHHDSVMTQAASPCRDAAETTKKGTTTIVKRLGIKTQETTGIESLSWKTQRREPKWETTQAKNILKDANKDVTATEATVHREDRGKPLKKRRLKVSEQHAEEEHKPTAKKKRRSKSGAIQKQQSESTDSSSNPSLAQSEDTSPQTQCAGGVAFPGGAGSVASPPESAGGSVGGSGLRKSQRSNRGKKYQELISQGLIQPSRNGSRRQEASDDHRTKVDGDFMPAPSGIMGSRRSRKRALSEASASQDDSARRTYKTGSFDLDACIASLPVCDLVFAKKSTKPLGGTTCHATKTALSGVKEGTDLNIVEVRRLTKQQPQSETDSETRLSGSQKRKARKCSITHLLECRSSTATGGDTDTAGATSPNTPSLKSSKYLETNNNTSQIVPPFSDVIVPVTATIATCGIGLGLLEDVAGTEVEHQSLPGGDAISANNTSTAIVVT